MKINTRIRYAIRMMADIAKHGQGNPVPLKDVAERQGLSKLYLSQLANPLRNGGLLRSVWGNRGGYIVARPPSEINLLDVMEAVDGPVSIIECVESPGSCERAEFCESIGVWRDINEAITETLKKYTLDSLVQTDASEVPAGAACFPEWKKPESREAERKTGG